MDLLQIREKEVFEILKATNKLEFVVIGGYAVNAYTLPRFSVDCDIVIKEIKELKKFQKALLKFGFNKREITKIDDSGFERYEKVLDNSFKVSFDILIMNLIDRQTNVSISADWIFKNSEIKILKGKTIAEQLKVRIIDIDALFVIKMISCRVTDIRDLFMLAPKLKDKDFIKKEVSLRYNFKNRFLIIKEKILSKEFRKGLQGVYGYIDTQTFERNVKAILELND